jgi:hypothetical protein
MNDSGGNFADETTEIVSETATSASSDLRKRRSTRIVQAVPLVVTGVDALGRPFVERTSSLIINCHGCRYQSKHYVLKNMWVTLEIPHPETGQPPRTVRGRVAWIQRPRTVRQLFQVALELEVSGNVWGIAFPPEDWTAFPELSQVVMKLDGTTETAPAPPPPTESETTLHLGEPETTSNGAADNVRVFPSPTSTTDASLQLARQVARLVADAKQQIQAATREAASQAVSAERRLSFEQWEQKFAAGRLEIANETAQAIDRFQRVAEEHSRTVHAAAAEALRTELPRWLAPQLEQLTRDLTESLSKEGLAQRSEHSHQLESDTQTVQGVCREAQEAAARLRTQAEQAQTQIAAHAEAATQAINEAAKQREDSVKAQLDSLNAAAAGLQQKIGDAISSAQSSLREQIAGETEAAHANWRSKLENTITETQDRAAGGLNEHANNLTARLQDDLARHGTAAQTSAANASAEAEQRIGALRDSLQQQTQQLESAMARAGESTQLLQQNSAQLEAAQQQALSDFQSRIDHALAPHRESINRQAQAVLQDINGGLRATFEEASRQAVAQFERQVQETVQPHITQAEEAVHRLAGGRSLLDAALTLQQERIGKTADDAFAESLARFRENLGGVEQLLQESSQAITWRNLTELEGKAGDLKHGVVEELLKSAEWYEKKAQTQIQNLAEKTIEHAANQLREKAGEVSSVFASELDHASRSFVGHAQTQMEEVVRDSFERARALFAEAADTTAAAFTDEVQRNGRQELDGFNEELQRSSDIARQQLAASRADLVRQTSAEQEAFLHRFQSSMSGALESGVAEAQKKVSEGFGPLLDSWKAMTSAHQQEMQILYAKMSEQSAEQYKNRLENVSNQWMLATVASLDHQSRDMISGIATSAEEQLRQACAHVFDGVGESLRERLREMATKIAPAAPETSDQAKAAKSGT